MSHALWKYDGLCMNIHGHSYELHITLIGEPQNNESSPKNGMVIDFSDLKRIVNVQVVERFDHALVVNTAGDIKRENLPSQMHDKLIEVPFQPTCENLVIHFVNIIKDQLPKEIKLFSVRLYETTNSFAEWYASDNE